MASTSSVDGMHVRYSYFILVSTSEEVPKRFEKVLSSSPRYPGTGDLKRTEVYVQWRVRLRSAGDDVLDYIELLDEVPDVPVFRSSLVPIISTEMLRYFRRYTHAGRCTWCRRYMCAEFV